MKPAILVLGADGPVGRGVVRAALEASWPVVAVSADPHVLPEGTGQGGGLLRKVAGSVADEPSAERLVAALRRLPHPFLGVIAAMEPAGERGRLLDAPADRLQALLDRTVVPQLAAARHLLPWLASTGRNCGYVVIGGPGCRHPWAGYGHRSVAASAVGMLVRALHAEALSFAVRLQLLDVGAPLRDDTARDGNTDAPVDTVAPTHAGGRWPTALEIGRKAVCLLEHRNDARCTGAVVDYLDPRCDRPARQGAASGSGERRPGERNVESRTASSSEGEANGFPGVTPTRVTPHDGGASNQAQESDGGPCAASARWLDDVRQLLDTLIPPRSNQERSR